MRSYALSHILTPTQEDRTMTADKPMSRYEEMMAARRAALSPEGRALAQALDSAFDLAASLLQLRHEAGITQAQLAAASGVPQADISRIERGRISPTVARAERIFGALGAPLRPTRNPGMVFSLMTSTVSEERATYRTSRAKKLVSTARAAVRADGVAEVKVAKVSAGKTAATPAAKVGKATAAQQAATRAVAARPASRGTGAVKGVTARGSVVGTAKGGASKPSVPKATGTKGQATTGRPAHHVERQR